MKTFYYRALNIISANYSVQVAGTVMANGKKGAVRQLINDGILHRRGYELLAIEPISD
jgi:hypothetical protein